MRKNILLIIIVLLGGLSLYLFISYQSISQKYIILRERNEELGMENRDLSQRLSESRAESRKLLERIGVIQRDLDRISIERDESRRRFEIVSEEKKMLTERLKAVSKLEEEIRLAKEENTILKRQLAQKEDERIRLDKSLREMERERETLNRRLAELERTLEEKKEVLSKEKAQVALPPIVVRPERLALPVAPLPAVSGKIIGVNRDYNFVIIDLGEEQGIKVGRTFRVFRDRKIIGRLEVIQVRSSVSACDIKEKSQDLKVGDIIK